VKGPVLVKSSVTLCLEINCGEDNGPTLRPTNMSLVSAEPEMGEAVGGSHLYPIVPIMNFLSMVLTLLLLPGFWKTRIVALVSVVGWIFIGNLAFFLSMIHWRGHTNDALVWASICKLVIYVYNFAVTEISQWLSWGLHIPVDFSPHSLALRTSFGRDFSHYPPVSFTTP
jgi:hypothetical protein